MSDEHRTLVEQATSGDPVAVEELIERHYGKLVGFLRRRADRLVLNKESISDLAQSVCREALLRAGSFDYQGEGAFVSWLYRVALSKVCDKFKFYAAGKRDARREVAVAGSDSTEHGPATLGDVFVTFRSPDAIAIDKERSAEFGAAFDRLSEEYQEVIFLAHVMELPRTEIGELIGKSHEATRSLLGRAVAKLGLLLADE